MIPTAPSRPPVDYIPRIAAQYEGLGYGTYRWFRAAEAPPLVPVVRPLADCRLALIATGGIYAVGQTAFHHRDDTSYRAIPTTIDTTLLRATHFAYDLTDARTDINCVFPIDSLRDEVRSGRLGALGPFAYTCMGGIYSTRRVREELVPPLRERLVADDVDLALLVPV